MQFSKSGFRIMNGKVDDEYEVGSDGLGAAIGLSRTRVKQLADEAVIVSNGRGRFPLLPNVRRYCEHLRDARRKTSQQAAISEKDRLRAKLLQLELDEREHKLIAVEEAEAVVDEIVGTFRTELASLPARCSRDLAVRKVIENATHDMLTTVSSLLSRRGAELRATGETSAAPSTDD